MPQAVMHPHVMRPLFRQPQNMRPRDMGQRAMLLDGAKNLNSQFIHRIGEVL